MSNHKANKLKISEAKGTDEYQSILLRAYEELYIDIERYEKATKLMMKAVDIAEFSKALFSLSINKKFKSGGIVAGNRVGGEFIITDSDRNVGNYSELLMSIGNKLD